MSRGRLAFWWLLVLPLALLALWGLFDDVVLFLKTFLNGLTLASLYFIVASGFTLSTLHTALCVWSVPMWAGLWVTLQALGCWPFWRGSFHLLYLAWSFRSWFSGVCKVKTSGKHW